MPTPMLPLTPSASMDISAQDKQWKPAHEPSLTLPPPALQETAEHSPLSPIITNSTHHLDSFNGQHPNPIISTTTKKARVVPDSKAFTLPSPPTRTRKIIQMKPPRPQPEIQSPNKRRKTISTSASAASSVSTTTAPSFNPPTAQPISKPTKKAIRKTAHSLIERRRRSKMNDAFATLKDMIPACRGGDDDRGKEMHKLDVLNAGIDYLGYLERCLARINERAWGGAGEEVEEEGAEEEEEGEVQEESRSSLAKNNKHDGESQLSEQHHWRQQHGEGKTPTIQDCHCRCPCHHTDDSHNSTTLLPSPPPSLEPRPQEHPSAQFFTYESRQTDTERDREETTSTAAALLMLTSTDRRREKITTSMTTVTSPIHTLDHPTSPIHHHHHHHTTTIVQSSRNQSAPHNQPHCQYEHEAEQERGPHYPGTETPRPRPVSTIKAGLSVRDLLLTN